MSWSYYKAGRAETVREDAKVHLEQCALSCKHVPSEAAACRSFAASVDAACEAAVGHAVKVEGAGSAYTDGGNLRGFNFSGKIELIDLS